MIVLFKYFLGIFKKIFFVVLVLFLIINAFGYFIQKDKKMVVGNNPVTHSRDHLYTKIKTSPLNDSSHGKVIIKIFRIASCFMAGELCTNNPNDADKNFNKSVVGFAYNLVMAPYLNPPASGVYWVHNTIQNAGFIPQSYAAEGIGFASIKPLMSMWKIFRDVSYMLLVLFLVIIGFMIMFRVKINPQTVISVENTLPKIAVTMILITLSFAIAGFMIDLMYIFIAIIISLLGNVTDVGHYNVPELQNAYLSAGPGDIYNALVGDVTNSFTIQHFLTQNNWTSLLYGIPILNQYVGLLDILLNFILKPLGSILVFGWKLRTLLGDSIAAIFDFISAVVLAWFTPGIAHLFGLNDLYKVGDNIQAATFSFGNLPGTLLKPGQSIAFLILIFMIGFFIFPVVIIGLLCMFTLLYVWARIFVLLLTSYIQIILLIIFSPFLIALELIPGSKLTFSQWIKNLAGELIAFPVVITIFSLTYILGQMNMWSGWIVNRPAFFSPPFLSSIDAGSFSFILQLGMAFLIPDFVKVVKDALGAKGVGVNAGPGLFFGGVSTAVGGVMGGVGTFSSIKMLAPTGVEKFLKKIGLNNIAEALSPSGTPDGKGK